MTLKAFKELTVTSDNLGLPTLLHDIFYVNLNLEIQKYNFAIVSENKYQRIAALIKMQSAFEAVDLQCPPLPKNKVTPFFQLKAVFFLSIQEAFTEEGIFDSLMLENLPSQMAKMLTKLPYDKCQALYLILKEPKESSLLMTQLQTLFGEDYSSDSREWLQFLMTHSIAYLDGRNCKNFTVTNLLDTQGVVLKIDNRLKMPRHIENYLRIKLPHIFLPVYAAKHIEVMNEAEKLSEVRTLVVTDVCIGSLAHSQIARRKGRLARNIAAVGMMQQMAQALIEIEASSTCFLDAKLSNWLVDLQGNIRVADTKSFIFARHGVLENNIPENEDARFITTKCYRPSNPLSGTVNVGAWHASILGRNLYTYLTSQEPPESPYAVNYNYSAFIETGGNEIKTLIQALIKEPEEARMSLQDALITLQDLQIKLDPDYANIFTNARSLSGRFGLDIKRAILRRIKKAMNLPGFDKIATLESAELLLKNIEESYQICQSKIKIIAQKTIKGIRIYTEEKLYIDLIGKLVECTNMDSFLENLVRFSNKLDEFLSALDVIRHYEVCKENLKHLNLSAKIYQDLIRVLDDRMRIENKLIEMASVAQLQIAKIQLMVNSDDLIKKAEKLEQEINIGTSLKILTIDYMARSKENADMVVKKINRLLDKILENHQASEALRLKTLRVKINGKPLLNQLDVDLIKRAVFKDIGYLDDVSLLLNNYTLILNQQLNTIIAMQVKYQQLKNEMLSLSVDDDSEMQTYLNSCDFHLSLCRNFSHKQTFLQKQLTQMEALITSFNEPSLKQLTDFIEDCKNNRDSTSKQKMQLAKRIKAAIRAIPVVERGRFLHSEDPMAQELRRAYFVYLDVQDEDYSSGSGDRYTGVSEFTSERTVTNLR